MEHPLNKYFEKIYVINLIERPDRRKRVKQRLQHLGINFEFFTTVKYDFAKSLVNKNLHPHLKHPNHFGCTLSHYTITKFAKEQKLENYLVFEDDSIFLKNFNDVIEVYLNIIPDNYDMVYFYNTVGKMTNKHKWVVENKLFTSHNCYSTAGLGMNKKFYDIVIDKLDEEMLPIDVHYRKLQDEGKYNIYTFSPNLTGQEEGFSDITNIYRGYWSSTNFRDKTKKDYF